MQKLCFIWLAKKENLMLLNNRENKFKTFHIKLNVRHVNGMTQKKHVRLVDKSLTVNIVVTSALLRIYPCVSFFGSCCLGFSRQKGKRIYLMLNWQDHGSKSPWHYHKVGKEVRCFPSNNLVSMM